MIQSLNLLITTSIALASMTTLLMFIPAIIELKKPLDAGPRLIPDSSIQMRLSALKTALFNIEDELKFDSQLLGKIGNFLCFIPNLEA